LRKLRTGFEGIKKKGGVRPENRDSRGLGKT